MLKEEQNKTPNQQNLLTKLMVARLPFQIERIVLHHVQMYEGIYDTMLKKRLEHARAEYINQI